MRRINTGTKVPAYYLRSRWDRTALTFLIVRAGTGLRSRWDQTACSLSCQSAGSYQSAGVFHEMVGAILRMERSAGESPASVRMTSAE
jgi:hypothetical protein